MRNTRNNNDRRSSSRDSKSYGKNQSSRGGRKGNKFAKGGDWLMMQVGICFLDETEKRGYAGYKTRILFSSTNDEYSWCVREAGEVTHWFGVEKGRELLLRAIEEGNALGTSAFYDQKDSDGLQGNARINIKNVITEDELEEAEQAAADEAWIDADDDEEEEERPIRKSTKAKSKTKSKAKSKPEPEPAYDSDDDDDEDDSEEEDDVQY